MARRGGCGRGADSNRRTQRSIYGLCALGLLVAALGLLPQAASASTAPRVSLHPEISPTPSKTQPFDLCRQHPNAPGVERCMIVDYPVAYERAVAQKIRTMAPSHRPNWASRFAKPASEAGPHTFGLDPAEIRQLYNLPSSGGTGQTVAIVDAFNDPYIESDLATYRSAFGLPACTTANGCFKKLNQSGVQGSYPANNALWSQEMALDVDMVSAVCPNCHIILVEANSQQIADLAPAQKTAVSAGATEISNSWAEVEFAGETGYDSYFNHPGIPITAASGDEGYDVIEKKPGVSYPAASPNVIAVGGTEISLLDGSENEAWEHAGSGCSAYEPKPSWQTDTGCPRRMVADVSAMAGMPSGVASIYDSYRDNVRNSKGELVEEIGTGWEGASGTSVSTPIIASTYALTDAYTRSLGPQAIYAYHAEGGSLHDITEGSNGSCGGSYFCTAVAGYDGPTGWGTPWGVPNVKPPPSATTSGATEIQETSTKLNGSVNPNGLDTHYYFEYGTTTSYGSAVPAKPGNDAGSGTSSVPVSATAAGLQPGTTYHYRVVASSSGGTTPGGDQTFTTTLSPQPAAYINGSTQDVYFRTTTSELSQWQWEASLHNWYQTSLGGSPAGNISAFVGHNGDQFAYYRGTNGAIWEAYWNHLTKGWSTSEVGGSAGGDPVGLLDPITEEQYVYFRGTDGAIWELYWQPSPHRWSLGRIGGSAAGNLTAYIDTGGVQNVYFRGTDNAIWQEQWEPSTHLWHLTRLGGSAAGNPTSYVNSGTHNVYFRGTDNAIWQEQWEPSTHQWSLIRLGGSATGGNISAFVGHNGDQFAYYRGANGAIWEAYWNHLTKGWSTSEVGGSAGGDPVGLLDPTTEEQYVYFRGTDGAIWELYWEPSPHRWSLGRIGGSAAG